MTHLQFNDGCWKHGFQPPDDLFDQLLSRIAMEPQYDFDDDFYLFLKEFLLYEPWHKDRIGITVCSLIRWIREHIEAAGYSKKIWWATVLAERMTKSMNGKLMEYKKRGEAM